MIYFLFLIFTAFLVVFIDSFFVGLWGLSMFFVICHMISKWRRNDVLLNLVFVLVTGYFLDIAYSVDHGVVMAAISVALILNILLSNIFNNRVGSLKGLDTYISAIIFFIILSGQFALSLLVVAFFQTIILKAVDKLFTLILGESEIKIF